MLSNNCPHCSGLRLSDDAPPEGLGAIWEEYKVPICVSGVAISSALLYRKFGNKSKKKSSGMSDLSGGKKTKFKKGDRVTINSLYLKEGRQYFGKYLKHTKLDGIVEKVYCYNHQEKDSFGNTIEDVVIVRHKNGTDSFASKFLKKKKTI